MQNYALLVKKLKAFILDEWASEWEQDNAIKILLKLKAKGIDIWEIPKKVRPKAKETIKVPVIIIKVITVISTTYKDWYYYEKIPLKRIKHHTPIFSYTPISEFDEVKSIEVEEEIFYKTKFYHYKIEYVSINKVKPDTYEIVEKWKEFIIDRKFIEESDNPIWNIQWWEDAFNETINNKMCIII